jgi:hypothetical protein
VPAGALHPGDPVQPRSASFFVTELLGVDELPHRPVIHLQAALAKFTHKTAQCEISSQSRCSLAIFFGLCPPILPGARLLVSRKRLTQRMTVLIPTSKRTAACRRDRPSRSTDATTRREDPSNKACPSWLASLPSKKVESDLLA